MIGWINNSVESFIRDTFGDNVWQTVEETAGLGRNGWVSSCPYPDSDTYKLVITASDLLGVTPAQALEAYGVYFVEYVTKQGYDKLLQTLGSNIAEFLQSLNNLHLHLTLTFPSMVAPAFKCTAVGPESLELHYYSNRPALGPIVVGVLHGLAERYWGMGGQLGVQLLRGREDGSDDHEVFRVTYPYQAVLSDWDASVAPAALGPPKHFFTVDADTFYQIFPFHILLDRECRVLQTGAALTRLFPALLPGVSLADHFELRHPYTRITFDRIRNNLNSAFLLRAKSTSLELKGQMVPVAVPCSLATGSACTPAPTSTAPAPTTRLSGSSAPGPCPASKSSAKGGVCPFAAASHTTPNPTTAPAAAYITPTASVADTTEGLLFMGSVRLGGLDDMRDKRLFLSDLPLHDLNRDMILLTEQRQAEAQLKERFEALTLDLKEANVRLSEATQWLEEERQRSNRLLYQMLPRHVATSLKHGARTPASEHEEATILFSDIVGFTEICSRCSPLEVCALLDELYHQFDTAIEEYPELYKVETIGDAYMVVANVTTACPNHADLVLEFALRMHEVARGVTSSLGGHVCIRVGMHTGPVVAGVVGKKMPRFCLFGDTVNTASRMESHGLPGQIHISDVCYECIRNKENFVIRDRGSIAVKGKGMMKTYLITPAEQANKLAGLSRLSLRSPSPSPSDAEEQSCTIAPGLSARSGGSQGGGVGGSWTGGVSGGRPSNLVRPEHLLPTRAPSFVSVSGQSDIPLPPWLANWPDPACARTSDNTQDRASDLGLERVSVMTFPSSARSATHSGTVGAYSSAGATAVLGLPDRDRNSCGSSLRQKSLGRRSSRLAQRSVDASITGAEQASDAPLASPTGQTALPPRLPGAAADGDGGNGDSATAAPAGSGGASELQELLLTLSDFSESRLGMPAE